MIDRKAVNFFREHAGYIVGRRLAGALALAKAETVAKDVLRYRWIADDDADLSFMSDDERRQPHEVEVCLAERQCPTCERWEIVGSLGGIVDADNAYRRVVEAELALEALCPLQPVSIAIKSTALSRYQALAAFSDGMNESMG